MSGTIAWAIKMTWWSWMIIGAVLLAAELFAVDAQFYLVFLGISAALVGLAGLFGIVMPEWAQWTAFAVLSLLSFFTFRKSLYQKIHGGVVGFRETLSGNTVTVDMELAAGAEARIDFRGTIRRPRIERRRLPLRNFLDLPKHLRCRSLVDTRFSLQSKNPHSLQDA